MSYGRWKASPAALRQLTCSQGAPAWERRAQPAAPRTLPSACMSCCRSSLASFHCWHALCPTQHLQGGAGAGGQQRQGMLGG